MLKIKDIFEKAVLLLIAIFIVSCSKDDSNNGSDGPIIGGPTNSLIKTKIIVNQFTEYQNIRGFGGINHPVWRSDMNAAEREKVFGNGDGQLGLSILRVHLDPDSNKWGLELPTAKYAISKGAIVFASPWTAPTNLLNPTREQQLLPENYDAYVNHLNNFNSFMDSNGVPLYAISIQNEPDYGEWTQWTTNEILTFMKENAQDINNKVIAPESFQFRRNYSDPILNDAIAAENIDIVGGHIYGGGLSPYPLAAEKGKEVWMTEYLMNQDATSSWSQLDDAVIWDETMEMLTTVHQSMTYNWNAYMWWYIQRYYSFIGDGSQGTVKGEVLKRGYAFSHYSRFVKPGYIRVGTDTQTDKGLEATAYKGTNETVLVILNPNANVVSGIGITIGTDVPESATLYITSIDKNAEKSNLAINNNELVFEMPAKSIATVVIPN